MKTYPVIHYLDHGTTLKQMSLIRRTKADGAFLISHRGNDEELIDIAWQLKRIHSDFKIGINLLSSSPLYAAQKALECGLDMIWADDMGVSSNGLTEMGQNLSVIAKANPYVGFFASVAFKYQKFEGNPALAAIVAKDAGFIPTTSGAGTGKAPSVDKISTMSYSVGRELAVASGMTPDNISLFAPYLNYVLVATGISHDDHHLDEDKLNLFIEKAAEQEVMPVPVLEAQLPPQRILTFSNESGEVGKLDFSGPEMKFTGKADESAEVFFNFVKAKFGNYLKESGK
jgi:hypothetical protein